MDFFKNKKTFLIIVFSIIFLYAFAVKTSESNFSCGFCHEKEHEQWEKSSHKKTNCRVCHIEPGIKGAFKAQFDGLGNLFVAVAKGTDIQPHDDPIPVSTQNCMECHAAIFLVNELGYLDLPDNTLKGQGLAIGHRIHIEKYKMDCVECHRGIVHRDPEEIGKYPINFPFMHKDCAHCHDGQFRERFNIEVTSLHDKKKCTVCHPYYIPPDEEYDN
jgi:hypothetical protein